MSFLKERMIKYWISLAFVPLWLLVIGVYYSRGHQFMQAPQRAILQFLIVVNSITLAILLLAGVIEVQSKIDKFHWKCSSVKGEIASLASIIVLQLAAAITLSAGTPSFQCSLHSACAGNVFFTVACWVLPVLFLVHLLEFFVRARRLASLDPMVWSTVVWLVEWDNPEHYQTARDMRQTATTTYHRDVDALERGALKQATSLSEKTARTTKNREPRKLMLPTLSRIPAIASPKEDQSPPRYNEVFNVKEARQPQRQRTRPQQASRRALRDFTGIRIRSGEMTPGGGVIIYVPEHIQYTVPTLQPAPRPKRKRNCAPPVPPKSWYIRR